MGFNHYLAAGVTTILVLGSSLSFTFFLDRFNVVLSAIALGDEQTEKLGSYRWFGRRLGWCDQGVGMDVRKGIGRLKN